MRHSTFKESYCEKLIEHMGKGLSISTFGATVGVTRKTVYEWFSQFPEFGLAKEIGEQKAQLFFENILSAKSSGRDIPNFDHKKSDIKAVMFALRTRFYETYGEKQKLEISGSLHSKLLDELENEKE